MSFIPPGLWFGVAARGYRSIVPPEQAAHRPSLHHSIISSENIREGTNALGVILGNGFYNLVERDLFQIEKARWKTPQKLLGELFSSFVISFTLQEDKNRPYYRRGKN